MICSSFILLNSPPITDINEEIRVSGGIHFSVFSVKNIVDLTNTSRYFLCPCKKPVTRGMVHSAGASRAIHDRYKAIMRRVLIVLDRESGPTYHTPVSGVTKSPALTTLVHSHWRSNCRLT